MGRYDMIKRVIDIQGYWVVVVYYNVDYSHFQFVEEDLINAGCMNIDYNRFKHSKAYTFSNISKHISIMCINQTSTCSDFINSVVHEAEHVKQAMLQAYNVEDKGELPAYTIGYLVQQILRRN